MSRRIHTANDFWAKVERGPGCWNWTGALTAKGSALASLDGVREHAHRIAFRLTYPDQAHTLDEGQQVRRSCGNVRYVNPDHLYTLRVPIEDAAAIRDEFYSGRATQVEIAKRYGVERTFITRLINGALPRYRTDGVA